MAIHNTANAQVELDILELYNTELLRGLHKCADMPKRSIEPENSRSDLLVPDNGTRYLSLSV